MPIAGFSKQMQSISLCFALCGIEIIHAEGQVELVVTEVVRLVTVAQPRQLDADAALRHRSGIQ